MIKYKKPTCRGCLILGTGCGTCEKCIEQRATINPPKKTTTAYPELTLRDQFAMAALTGELSSQSFEIGQWLPSNYPKLAERMYKLADAMLKARENDDAD